MQAVTERVDNFIKKQPDASETELILKATKDGGVDFKAIILVVLYNVLIFLLFVAFVFKSVLMPLSKDFVQLPREAMSNFSQGEQKTYINRGHEFNSVSFYYNDNFESCTFTYEFITDGYTLANYDSIKSASSAYYSEVLNVSSNLLEKGKVNGIEFFNYSIDNKIFYAFTSSKTNAVVLIFNNERGNDKCLTYKEDIFNHVHYRG